MLAFGFASDDILEDIRASEWLPSLQILTATKFEKTQAEGAEFYQTKKIFREIYFAIFYSKLFKKFIFTKN